MVDIQEMQGVVQDEELVCNEINYKDLPEKCRLGHLVVSKKHVTQQKK